MYASVYINKNKRQRVFDRVENKMKSVRHQNPSSNCETEVISLEYWFSHFHIKLRISSNHLIELENSVSKPNFACVIALMGFCGNLHSPSFRLKA